MPCCLLALHNALHALLSLCDTSLLHTRAGVAKALKEGLLDKVILPVASGANTQVYLAAGADNADGKLSKRTDGVYYDLMKPASPTSAATDGEAAKRLWEVSERLTGAKIAL